jgi:hypothetical protein
LVSPYSREIKAKFEKLLGIKFGLPLLQFMSKFQLSST